MSEEKNPNNYSENDSNKVKYSEINTNEDSYIDIKEDKIHPDTEHQNITNKEIVHHNDNNEGNLYKKEGILNKKIGYYCFRKLGHTYTFFGNKNGSPLIVLGPNFCWYISLIIIVTIVLYLFLWYFWNFMNLFFKALGILIYIIFIISYSYTSLINPGIPIYDENAILGRPRDKYTFCRACCIWTNMDLNTTHCFTCNVCYEGFDHHCPWTGKCIAKNNLITFYVFLASIISIFCYFITALTHAQHNIFLANNKTISH